jgi:hypothetical protein
MRYGLRVWVVARKVVFLRRRVDAPNPSAEYASVPVSMYYPSITTFSVMQKRLCLLKRLIFLPYTRIKTSRH